MADLAINEFLSKGGEPSGFGEGGRVGYDGAILESSSLIYIR